MLLFVVYAMVTWFLSAKYRRRWAGLWVFLASTMGLTIIAILHLQLNEWLDGAIYIRQLQLLLYPYAALVLGVALMIVCMPRNYGEMHCQGCGYDMRGQAADQPDEALVCPECGRAWKPPEPAVELIGKPTTRITSASHRAAQWRELKR